VRACDGLARLLDGIGPVRNVDPVENVDELRQDEDTLDARPGDLDCCDDVVRLEPDDERDVGEVGVVQAACGVRRDVEAECARLADGRGKRLGPPEVERAVRFHAHRQALGGGPERGRRKHAPEAVSRTDERGAESHRLHMAQYCRGPCFTCPVSSPAPANDAPYRLIDDVEFGRNVTVSSFTNLYGCRIGDDTRIGPFVEVQRDAVIGARCKIQSHSFICTGVEIEDEVFVGHGTLFINDKHPRATTEKGSLKGEGDWMLLHTVVERGATLGSGAVIMGGVRIGAGALVGAGAVVTSDVAAGETVAGVPARATPSGTDTR
jgi:UDP-2-acetamido-3-amino-2,3-dideoxy-glucuronate N-acetyltransferase